MCRGHKSVARLIARKRVRLVIMHYVSLPPLQPSLQPAKPLSTPAIILRFQQKSFWGKQTSPISAFDSLSDG